MNRVFISYSRSDETFARRIAASLSDSGLDVWIDVDDIPSGMKWSTAIQEGLLTSDVMVVIISPDSMASRNVEDEWQYFLDKRKLVLPLLWRPADIHFQLNRIQYINFYTQPYNFAVLRLLEELKRAHLKVRVPAYLTPTKLNSRVGSKPVSTPAATVPLRPRSKARPSWMYAGTLVLVAALLVLAGIVYSTGVTASPKSLTQPTAILEARVLASVSTNIRNNPSPNSPRIGALSSGQSAVILGADKNRAWWYIRAEYTNGRQILGWVSAAVVDTQGNLDVVQSME